jgi:hypothetical protein
VKEYTPH